MNESVVVDASLAIKWLVEEDGSDKARAVLESWVSQDSTRVGPCLMPFEVASALHLRVVRSELSVGGSARMIARLLGSRLKLHQPPILHVRALELAIQLSQSAAYYAHYLPLAEESNCGVVNRRPEVPPSGSIQRGRPLDRRIRLIEMTGQITRK